MMGVWAKLVLTGFILFFCGTLLFMIFKEEDPPSWFCACVLIAIFGGFSSMVFGLLMGIWTA